MTFNSCASVIIHHERVTLQFMHAMLMAKMGPCKDHTPSWHHHGICVLSLSDFNHIPCDGLPCDITLFKKRECS